MSALKKHYNQTLEATIKDLKTNEEGLSDNEAKTRLKRHGLNKLPEEKKTPWLFLFLNQFKNSLVYILLGAAIISLVIQEFTDMYVILAAVIVNVIVGFIQEYKATQAMEKLKKVITYFARVKRNGKEREVKTEELVPGDIVLLKAGDKVPADGRLILSKDLEINEASLTGESIPVKKNADPLKEDLVVAEQKNMVFLGTVVVQGMGKLVVTTTGINTELGKIAILIKDTPEERTPFQKKLDRFSRWLGGITLGVSFLIFVIGMLEGVRFDQIFTTSVAIAVSAIPEGLVIAVTAILAVGMQRILKQNALVKKLVAAETLGSTTVICTDKTGTLTEGDMRVAKLVTLHHDLSPAQHHGSTPQIKESMELVLMFKIGVLSNNAAIQNPQDEFSKWKMIGNPTEKSLLSVGARLDFYREDLEKEEPRLDEIPFDSEKKYMLTLHQQKNKNVIYLKGAPEKVLKMSKRIQDGNLVKQMNFSLKRKFQKEFEEMSKTGLRILAFGYQPVDLGVKNLDNPKQLKELSDQFIFLGFVGIKDPLRKETKETVDLCKKAGINIVIITGDHKLTAQAIAKELGLKSKAENILEGKDLAKLTHKELVKRVRDISVYARVTPKDKLQIVDAWQEKGEVVAMTGDGVNDAPALKTADIGIALGSGSDVAKEISDMVILDNNFKTIVAAVREGRIIFDNIKKVILYLLSNSFSEIILITGTIMINIFFVKDLPLPLLASQILWINLVTDSFPGIALTLEPQEAEIMNDKPLGKSQTLFTKEMKILSALISSIIGLVSLFSFLYFVENNWDIMRAQTIIFSIIAVSTLLYVFSVRSLRHPIFSRRIFSNQYLIYAIMLGLAMQLVAVYFPPFQKIFKTVALHPHDWVIVAGASLILILIIEVAKYLFVLTVKDRFKT